MTVFDKKKDTSSNSGVREILGKSFNSGEWVTTTDLYRACSMRVKRDLLHVVLKEMLSSREIVMRVVNRDGRVTNEFKGLA